MITPHPRDLMEMSSFGSNPGALRAWTYVPVGLPASAPLVVILHGAMQTAAEYDRGSGWSRLADRCGFALLYPEQTRANNAMRCFNWYEAADNARGKGEAFSICAMIEAVVRREGLDRARVFVTGLSSGGAMAAVMMAAYPEMFAGGAIIAGLAYGSARGVLQAMDRMNGLGGPKAADLEAAFRAASKHDGPWPVLSIWHGGADRTVHVSNVEAIAGQWRGLHALAAEDARQDVVDGHPRLTWTDAGGRAVLEIFEISGMGHGTPLATSGADGFGVRGSHMLEVEISSTLNIARFWLLASRKTEI
jgi:poly(hydroxyalkanoate) depolymerase family esterase